MEKRICILLVFFLGTFNSYGQEDEDKLNLVQISFGIKNPFGAASIAYNRRIMKEKFGLEFRVGLGINHGFVYGTGTSVRLCHGKRFELVSSLDFIGNVGGLLSYDEEGYSDKYSYSPYFFLSPHVNGRLYFGKDVSLELKLGYSFLLNQPEIIHLQGEMDYYDKAKWSIGNGLLVGLGLNFGW